MNLTSFISAVAQAATAPQAPDQQLMDIDATVFVQLGLFLLTMFLLTKLLWRPYLRVRQERTTRVEGYREEAARLEQEAAVRLTRVEAQLAEARRAGSLERAKARNEAQAREQKLVAEAQAAASRTLAEARSKLDAAFAAEASRLQERAATLGREIAEKVLGRKAA
jgi:F-type H+-transporting ATPase subunit b